MHYTFSGDELYIQQRCTIPAFFFHCTLIILADDNCVISMNNGYTPKSASTDWIIVIQAIHRYIYRLTQL